MQLIFLKYECINESREKDLFSLNGHIVLAFGLEHLSQGPWISQIRWKTSYIRIMHLVFRKYVLEQRNLKYKKHLYCMAIQTPPQNLTPYPRSELRGHHNHALSFSQTYMLGKEDFLYLIYFYYMAIVAPTLRLELLSQRAINFTIYIKGLMDITTMHLVSLIYMWKQRRSFKDLIHFKIIQPY